MCFTAAENSATPAKTPLMVSDPVIPSSSRRSLQAAFQPGRSLVLGAFVLGGQPVADHPDATQRGVALRTIIRAVRNCIDIFYTLNMQKHAHMRNIHICHRLA